MRRWNALALVVALACGADEAEPEPEAASSTGLVVGTSGEDDGPRLTGTDGEVATSGSDDADGSDSEDREPVVPDIPYCSDVSDWFIEVDEAEAEVLRLVNEARAIGGDCGSMGMFAPAPPLTMQPNLRCAARVHSLDMALNDYLGHTNAAGESAGDRASKAGYEFSTLGENVASGQNTPKWVVQDWLHSDPHCANIFGADFTEIGVGYMVTGSRWTQVFAAPK